VERKWLSKELCFLIITGERENKEVSLDLERRICNHNACSRLHSLISGETRASGEEEEGMEKHCPLVAFRCGINMHLCSLRHIVNIMIIQTHRGQSVCKYWDIKPVINYI